MKHRKGSDQSPLGSPPSGSVWWRVVQTGNPMAQLAYAHTAYAAADQCGLKLSECTVDVCTDEEQEFFRNRVKPA
jgi:hypothetical protein